MFSFLRSVFKEAVPAPARAEPALGPSGPQDAPPDGARMAFLPQPRAALLQANEDILIRIKLCYGRESRQFEQDILAVVTRYADYVNALPATADSYHARAGGLLRLGLETAFYALQATDAQIFEGRGTITQRRHLEPRWRHAAFIAGLCAELQPILDILGVATRDGDGWPSYSLPLSSWLDRHHGAQFHLVWRAAPRVDGVQCLYALPHIVPASMMEYLAERNDVVVPAMLAALSRLPLPTPPATMGALVRRAATLAIDKELRRMASARGIAPHGNHLARLLIDIMHDLAHSIAGWVPNSEKSRVWHARDGTFLVWPGAYQEMTAYADHERLQGLPADADGALTVLASAGMVERDQDGPLWRIRTPGAGGELGCIKLAVPELVLGSQLATCPPLPPLGLRSEPTQHAQSAPAPGRPRPVERAGEPCVSDREAAPAQMELALAPASLGDPGSGTGAVAGRDGAARNRPALVNCLRLPSDVAAPVRHAVESLGANDGAANAHLVREGILLPMEIFKEAGLDIRSAIRSLRDAGMLGMGESGSPNYTTTLNGVEVRGIVIKRQFVTGLPPAR